MISEKDNVKILIAEDEESNYLYIKTLLDLNKERNYEILYARNGAEAVEICLRNNDLQLVLMDIKMPIMNGYDATTEIRKKDSNIPIIAQTAFVSSVDKKMALEVGCDAHITKPIDRRVLFDTINSFLDKES